MPSDRRYTARVDLPVDAETAFAYHERPGALRRLVPPWEDVTVEHSDGSLEAGSRVVLVNKMFGLSVRWVAEHTRYEPPHLFADTQVSGPFERWDHVHRFDGSSGDASTLTDDITYRVPFGPAGRVLGGGTARRTIERMFAYRHRITRDDLDLFQRYDRRPLTVAISGMSGMVGSSLAAMLRLFGHRVIRLVRKPSDDPDEVAIWEGQDDGNAGGWRDAMSGIDAVVHLAGKSIADQRWTDEVKRQIRDSRIDLTTSLARRLTSLESKPSVVLSASAIGIYGDRGTTRLTESDVDPDNDDFLVSVARDWESAADPLREAGVRVVHPRLGIVLSSDGGALQKSLLPAKFGGGRLGSGKQVWSWIALDDVVGGMYHAIHTDSLEGPVNFVAPSPVTNHHFANRLSLILNRPINFPAPAFALRLALGEMADALLLRSADVSADKLTGSGYRLRFAELDDCLRYTIGKDRKPSVATEAAA